MNPTYVRVTVKGKILQLTLPCEVSAERSNVRRNTTTGSLVIAMARLVPDATIVRNTASAERKEPSEDRETRVVTVRPPATSRRALLEIGPPSDILDMLRVTGGPASAKRGQRDVAKDGGKDLEDDFEDNPDVPPLE